MCPMKKGGVYIKCVYIKPFGFNLYPTYRFSVVLRCIAPPPVTLPDGVGRERGGPRPGDFDIFDLAFSSTIIISSLRCD